MKYIIFALASLLTILATIDIIVLNDITRGMLAVVVAANILVIGKLDTLMNNGYADRQQEREDTILTLIDKVCPDCQDGKELFLNKDNFYCHWDPKLEEHLVCYSHALHDAVNSWATQVETEE